MFTADFEWVLEEVEIRAVGEEHPNRLVMSLALPYAHIPPIFAFLTLPIKPDYTTVTAIQCNLPCWWTSTLSSTHLCHFMILCTFMPYEYMTPYNPPCKLEVLWPQVMTSHLHHYSCDTASGSHMIMCELHWLLLSWMNLGPMATHYDRFPSPCWVQHISVATSLSDLLLYSLIVIHSADLRFLSDWLVWWPRTLFFK